MVLLFRLYLLIAFGVATTMPASPKDREPSIASYRINDPFTLHEPIVLEREFENAFSEELKIYLGRNSVGELQFELTRPDGRKTTVRPGDPPPAGGAFTNNLLRLKPGERYTQRIVLNEWLDFPDVGTY